jgi:hypothetical protein
MNQPRQLREIGRIISDFGSESSKSLFLPNQKNTQLRLLARKIAGHEKADDRTWAKEICNTSESDQTYIRLRSQLKRRMLGLLFHLDIRTGSEIRMATYRSAQDVFCIRMLVIFGARQVAMLHVPRALERARKYELTQDRIELLLLLRSDATLNGYRTKFTHYARELKDAEMLRRAEMRLRSISDEINVELVARAETSAKAKVLARAALPEAEIFFSQFPTFNIGLNYYRIATLASESLDNTRRTFELCAQAEQFLHRFPHLVSTLYLGQFAIKRMSSAFSEGNYETALSAKSILEPSFPEGTNNWFIWKEVELLICMHTTRFTDAVAIHKHITNHERFHSQTEQVREKWAIFGHYVVLASGKGKFIKVARQRKDFDKILNEVPVYKRDKAGYNASLLILQQLILALKGDLDGMIVKSETLKRYISRNLRGRRESRLYAFMKTLLLLQKYDFDVEKVQKRAKKYIAQFKRFTGEKIDEKQTLPYFMMWEWISEGVEIAVKLRAEEALRGIMAVLS